ncbi:hypothetical protein MAR_001784 [Mya arenaria]|uniref:Uncharacterized protein n=1 Tax=Mya arenaria TaxID=6604 RepID=A0ABY7FL55_MYAAR|nr:hypothetical protein MAR_001784 [Mya arenaria]
MAKSAKERMQEYRRKIKENAQKYEKHKAADRERYKDKKERGVVKMVHDMSHREQRKCRRNWKKNSQVHRDRKKMYETALTSRLTPPTSPQELQNQPVQVPRQLSMIKSHKRRKTKEKSACYRLNEKLKVKLKCQQRLTERYKKRFYRIKRKDSASEASEDEQEIEPRAYRLYQTLVMNVRKWYSRSNSRLERRMLSNVIVGKRVLKKYGLGAYARSVLGISRRYMYRKGRSVRPAGVKSRMKTKVKSFLERDDNSRITSDKQATITRNGVKMQKRLLNGDLINLYKKYESEGNKISYSMFCKLRPFWIVKPTEKDRDTCLCKLHENLNYKIQTSYKENMVHSKDANVLINEIVCTQENKECMYRECRQCEDKQLSCENADGKQVLWNMWKNQRIDKEKDGKKTVVNKTVKEKVQGTKETLADELNKELSRACRHVFNIRHQYKSLKYLQQKMTHEEIMVHIDFSENYNTKYANEIQSVHFGASKQQIRLHTGIAYLGDDKVSFCSVSDCLKHGPAAIWAHLAPVITYLKTRKRFSVIHFVTDGPTTQYRNKLNFYLWCTKVFDYGCTLSTWNFLEAAHGKGAADGVGAAVKRAADKQVHTYQKDITSGREFVANVQQCSSVMMIYVEEQSILELESQLPTSLKPLTDTMKIHQLITDNRSEIAHRVVSSFCRHPVICSCFSPTRVLFPEYVLQLEPDSHATHIVNPDCGAQIFHYNQTPKAYTDAHMIIADAVHTSKADAVQMHVEQKEDMDERLIGRYCIIDYDGLPYPGLILDIDEEGAEVSAMCRIGANRFFWPLIEDRLWYGKEKIVALLETEPELVTNRHRKLDDSMWKHICDKLGLDNKGKK